MARIIKYDNGGETKPDDKKVETPRNMHGLANGYYGIKGDPYKYGIHNGKIYLQGDDKKFSLLGPEAKQTAGWKQLSSNDKQAFTAVDDPEWVKYMAELDKPATTTEDPATQNLGAQTPADKPFVKDDYLKGLRSHIEAQIQLMPEGRNRRKFQGELENLMGSLGKLEDPRTFFNGKEEGNEIVFDSTGAYGLRDRDLDADNVVNRAFARNKWRQSNILGMAHTYGKTPNTKPDTTLQGAQAAGTLPGSGKTQSLEGTVASGYVPTPAAESGANGGGGAGGDGTQEAAAAPPVDTAALDAEKQRKEQEELQRQQAAARQEIVLRGTRFLNTLERVPVNLDWDTGAFSFNFGAGDPNNKNTPFHTYDDVSALFETSRQNPSSKGAYHLNFRRGRGENQFHMDPFLMGVGQGQDVDPRAMLGLIYKGDNDDYYSNVTDEDLESFNQRLRQIIYNKTRPNLFNGKNPDTGWFSNQEAPNWSVTGYEPPKKAEGGTIKKLQDGGPVEDSDFSLSNAISNINYLRDNKDLLLAQGAITPAQYNEIDVLYVDLGTTAGSIAPMVAGAAFGPLGVAAGRGIGMGVGAAGSLYTAYRRNENLSKAEAIMKKSPHWQDEAARNSALSDARGAAAMQTGMDVGLNVGLPGYSVYKSISALAKTAKAAKAAQAAASVAGAVDTAQAANKVGALAKVKNFMAAGNTAADAAMAGRAAAAKTYGSRFLGNAGKLGLYGALGYSASETLPAAWHSGKHNMAMDSISAESLQKIGDSVYAPGTLLGVGSIGAVKLAGKYGKMGRIQTQTQKALEQIGRETAAETGLTKPGNFFLKRFAKDVPMFNNTFNKRLSNILGLSDNHARTTKSFNQNLSLQDRLDILNKKIADAKASPKFKHAQIDEAAAKEQMKGRYEFDIFAADPNVAPPAASVSQAVVAPTPAVASVITPPSTLPKSVMGFYRNSKINNTPSTLVPAHPNQPATLPEFAKGGRIRKHSGGAAVQKSVGIKQQPADKTIGDGGKKAKDFLLNGIDLFKIANALSFKNERPVQAGYIDGVTLNKTNVNGVGHMNRSSQLGQMSTQMRDLGNMASNNPALQAHYLEAQQNQLNAANQIANQDSQLVNQQVAQNLEIDSKQQMLDNEVSAKNQEIMRNNAQAIVTMNNTERANRHKIIDDSVNELITRQRTKKEEQQRIDRIYSLHKDETDRLNLNKEYEPLFAKAYAEDLHNDLLVDTSNKLNRWVNDVRFKSHFKDGKLINPTGLEADILRLDKDYLDLIANPTNYNAVKEEMTKKARDLNLRSTITTYGS